MPAPAAAPVVEAVVEAPVGTGSDNPNSPVSAAAAASAATQAALAAGEPVVEAPAAAPVAEALLSTPALTPQSTGNDTFDQVGKLLADKGVTNVNAILEEAAAGEISLANQAALVEALGEGVAGLALRQLQAEMTTVTAAGKAEHIRIKEYAAKLFNESPENAEEAWQVLNNFAASSESGLSDDDRDALNGMLVEGGSKANWAVNELRSRYEKSQGFSKAPNLVDGNRPNASGFVPMTKQEYQAEIAPAMQKFGQGSPEVNAIQQRRLASQRRGF
jgi:hypothetical protein